MVDTPELSKQLIVNGLDTFVKNIIKPTTTKKTTQNSPEPSDKTTVEKDPPSPKDKSLSVIKNSVTPLEADFTEFRQNTVKNINELTTRMKDKDEEIEKLKKINELK